MNLLRSIVWLILAWPCCVCGAEPLHKRIDQMVGQQLTGPVAPRTNDSAFLRRVYLDFVGTIPSLSEARDFLRDEEPTKRRKLIDDLLADSRHVERMVDHFHVQLMEQRGDNEDWTRFLRYSFGKNSPWDEIVRTILAPPADDVNLRGAAYFMTRRLEKVGQQATDYPGLTRDVGRLFLGVDLQCAECHDHLFIDDYKQRDFQGLFAVYRNVTIGREKFPIVNEKAMTSKLEFASVFTGDKQSTGPRLPFGREFEIPLPAKAEKQAADDKQTNSFSPLQLIAAELPTANNRLFSRNISNRLWYFMMGHGLVEPLDQFHADNQASHPELLNLLADELAAHKFDIKWFLRELALTETWQRSSRIESGDLPPMGSYRTAFQRRLTSDQLLQSVLQATGDSSRAADELGQDGVESELRDRFIKAFAAEPKQPALAYTPSVKQALFLLNDDKLLDLLQPRGNNLIKRLLQLPDADVAEEVYLSIFTRQPSDEERRMVAEFLAQAKDRQRALRDLSWAMLSSVEFGINH